MTDDTKYHLDEKTLSLSLVDEGLLSDGERAHLSHCAECRSEKEKTERALSRLGGMAARMVPAATRKPQLPADLPFKRLFPRQGILKPVLGTAMVAVAMLVVLHFRPAPIEPTIAQSDDQFMIQIGKLVNNALSPAYQGITCVIDPSDEDDPTEFIVPEVPGGKDISTHQKNDGVIPC